MSLLHHIIPLLTKSPIIFQVTNTPAFLSPSLIWLNLKGNHPEYSLEALMLKLQYFGHLLQTSDSLEKILMLEKVEDIRRRGGTENEMVGWHHQFNERELGQTLEDGGRPWGRCAAVYGVTKSQTLLGDWTITIHQWLLKTGRTSTWTQDPCCTRIMRDWSWVLNGWVQWVSLSGKGVTVSLRTEESNLLNGG